MNKATGEQVLGLMTAVRLALQENKEAIGIEELITIAVTEDVEIGGDVVTVHAKIRLGDGP